MKKWETPIMLNLGLSKTNNVMEIGKKDKTDCCGHNITNESDFWAEGNHHGWCCEWRNHKFRTNVVCS